GRAGGVGLRFQIVDLAVAWTENGRAGEGGSVFKVGATYHPLTSRVLSPFVGGTVGFGSWKLPAEAKGVGILDGWGLELDSVVGVTVPLGSFRWQIEVVGTLPAYTLRWEPKDGGRAPEQDDLFHIRGGLRTGLGWVF
ncbi:MAG TPA: hypothetical protein PKY30_25115, partial [Myxococcota bacterium]|nr:hypothetical protein [Myxococcota bacterium]